MGTTGRQIIYAFVAAALTVAAWWAWLGWDHQYQPDGTGPYEAWQVIGLVLTLGVVAGLAGRRAWFWLVAPVMAIALTVTWSLDAAAADETGLWGVGAVLVLIGTGAGTALVAGIVNALVRRRRPAPTVRS